MGHYHIGNCIRRVVHTFFICIFLLGFYLPPSFAEDFSEDDIYDLILEVKRERKTLSVAIFALEKDGKYYVPIQELARIVYFNAETDLNSETVKGFFISEENSYNLNVREGTYTLKGNTQGFDPGEAIIHQQQFGIGDIYVTPDLLNKIWPLDLSLDPLLQTLNIQTKRTLPYQLLAERQRNRNKRFGRKRDDDNSELNLPRVENDYKLFSMPALDFSSTTRFENDAGGIGQVLNISGRHDLLKMQANYNFSFDREPEDGINFENSRFLLERQSYEDGDLPVGLKLFQLGDIRPKPSRLIDGSLRGRGVLFSTEPQKQIKDFDQITVEGTAEPGWEVELYRGSELVDFQVVDEKGEYRFEDVALNYNTTKIKTILYGPEGQVKEQEETYNISNSMLRPGKTTFEASILDNERDLILTDSRPRNRQDGIAQNYKIKHGISSWLSAFATFTDTPTSQEDHRYATLGLNLSFFGVSGLIEAYKDLSEGTAFDFRAATNFSGINLNFRNSLFSDFESEYARYDGAARKSRTELTASKPFKLPFGNIGLRFKLDHEKFKTNPDLTELDLSQSYSGYGLRITHGNNMNLVNRDHRVTDGRINATYKINPEWQLRSFFNYDIFPEWDTRNVQAELRYNDRNKFTASANVLRNLQDQGTRLGGRVAYDFEKFRTGLNVDWEKDQGFRAFLRATFSMAPYGKNGDYIYNSKNLSNKAALNGLVFLDEDYDGEFDPEEPVLQDAILDIGRRETHPSDESGYATYIGSTRNQYENVILNPDSLENPFMISGVEGYNTVLRPATAPYLHFPVIETGVIDGTITTIEGPLAGVRVQLLENDEVINDTISAFDGYYTFEFIKPGDYIIRIDPSYEQLNIPPRYVSVTSENLFLDGIDFQIFGQAEEAACVETGDDNGRITQNCQTPSAQSGVVQPAQFFSDQVTNFLKGAKAIRESESGFLEPVDQNGNRVGLNLEK